MRRSFPVLGLLAGLLAIWWVRQSQSASVAPPPPPGAPAAPIRVLEIDADRPLPELHQSPAAGGGTYRSVRALVKLHDRPVGSLDFDLPEAGLAPEELGTLLWTRLGAELSAHWQADGLGTLCGLPAGGLVAGREPACVARRRAVLAHAPFFSVVVCTRNRSERLQELLPALLAMAYPAFEVVLVDNAPSDDRTAQAVSALARHDPRLRYVLEPRPGLSNARNAGLRAARGPLIAMTDDDVRPDPHWLTALAEGFTAGDGQHTVGCVTGPAPAWKLETPAQVQFEQYGGFGQGFEPQRFDLDTNTRDYAGLYPYAAGRFGSGVNMAYRQEVFTRTGLFDPALGTGTPTMGGEDLAMFVEVLHAGYQLVYYPDALVFHDHRADETSLAKQLRGNGTGLTAYLTSTMLRDPLRRIPAVMRRVPSGLVWILQPAKAEGKPHKAKLAPELLRAERQAMLRGPLAYLTTRRKLRRS